MEYTKEKIMMILENQLDSVDLDKYTVELLFGAIRDHLALLNVDIDHVNSPSYSDHEVDGKLVTFSKFDIYLSSGWTSSAEKAVLIGKIAKRLMRVFECEPTKTDKMSGYGTASWSYFVFENGSFKDIQFKAELVRIDETLTIKVTNIRAK
jgi:hypothetical protein